ncbi:MAG: hypothetical protein HC912_03330 [Saprospiraceae bacterium]|nr:hypothetical protein [Saprospiraceae bacterium]
MLVQLKSIIDAELKSLEAMPAFEGDSTYKAAAIALVSEIKRLASESYPTLLNILKKPQTELTQEDVNTFNTTIGRVQENYPC